MELSHRLKTVADMATPADTVADIGCDHAYISIYLIEHGLAKKVIAMDVNQGPLDIAKNNISQKGYRDKIETRLSDGLEKLGTNEANTIIIAGMGGGLMSKILQDGGDKLHKVNELILQPQSEAHKVRKILDKLGFVIVEEKMLIDGGKYYLVIRGQRNIDNRTITDKTILDKNIHSPHILQETHYIYGKYLLDQQDPILYQYLTHEKKVKRNIKEKLEYTDTDNSKTRLEEINKELKYINVGLDYYK